MEKRTVQQWKPEIIPALQSKRSEFILVGYGDVTEDMIWRCLEERVWKGNPTKRIHEVIQDIFHLRTTTYMNFIAVDALVVENDDLMSSIQAVMQPNK